MPRSVVWIATTITLGITAVAAIGCGSAAEPPPAPAGEVGMPRDSSHKDNLDKAEHSHQSEATGPIPPARGATVRQEVDSLPRGAC